MYKYLLCSRYLKTRYIALASVISVMLGVATMIVVNSVMAGFSDKMRDRLHGVLADVVVESYSLDGFFDWQEVMARVESVSNGEIVALAPTMETFALMKFKVGSESITKQVQLIGVKPLERAKTGDFAEFLFTGRLVRDKKTGKVVEERIDPPSFDVSDEIRISGTKAGASYQELTKGKTKDETANDPFLDEIKAQMVEEAPERGAIIGPDTTLLDCEVGEDAIVRRTDATLAVIGSNATVGPFSYLRPGTYLGADGKIGAFVETKNSRIGRASKVPHLSYIGDTEIGDESNVGAGTITANYDGVTKNRTTIGSHARVGSHTVLVAPVSIGDGAYTGAGTVVRKNVPPGALAITVAPQRNVVGWVEAKRPGSAAAKAAAESAAAAEPR